MKAQVLIAMAGLVGSVACGSASSSMSPFGPSPLEVPDGGDGTVRSTSPRQPLAASEVSGVWTLYTVDGGALPYVVSRFQDIKTELLSDVLTLNANGTSTERAESRFTAGPRVATSTTTASGTFTVQGSTLQLSGDNGLRTATWREPLLIVTVNGKLWIFRRTN
jgi:hypothetical protein